MKPARFLGSVLIVTLAAAGAHAGVHYVAATTMTADGKPQPFGQSTVEAWVEGEQAKIVFTESDNPMAPQGTYLVTPDAGRTLFLVNPQERTYQEWDLEQLARLAGSALESAQQVMNIEFSDAKVSPASSGPGGEVLGLATTVHEYTSSYGVSMSILGMQRSSQNVTRHRVWTTDALDAPALGVWLRRDPPRTGSEQLDRLIASQMQAVPGLPLRVESVTTTESFKGKKNKPVGTSTSEYVMEVTRLEQADVPASTFEIPSDYRKVEPQPVAPAADGDPEEQQEPNPMKRLKGLFGGG